MYKKSLKKNIVILTLVMLLSLTLSSCKISDSYAEKINTSFEKGTPLTYNDVMITLGTPFSQEIEGTPSVATGYAEWFEGYVEGEEDKFVKDNQKGKKIKAIYVEFVNGKAVGAKYYVVNE